MGSSDYLGAFVSFYFFPSNLLVGGTKIAKSAGSQCDSLKKSVGEASAIRPPALFLEGRAPWCVSVRASYLILPYMDAAAYENGTRMNL